MGSKIRTFIFLDCETTGLGLWSKITELCLVAIQADHLLSSSDELPRVMNKLNLCINPHKLIGLEASNLTGLTNYDLEFLSPFSSETVNLIESFIKHLPQPVCFVAHNGNKFDYPILHKHLERVKSNLTVLEDVLAIDSLQLFRDQYNLELEKIKVEEEEKLLKLPEELRDDEFDILAMKELDRLESTDDEFIARSLEVKKINETTPKKKTLLKKAHDNELFFHPTEVVEEEVKPIRKSKKKLQFGNKSPSFKLRDLFERMTGLPATHGHAAEYDVYMLIKCAAAIGEQFLMMANGMAVPFMEFRSLMK